MPKIDLIEMHMAAAHFPIALLMSSAFFEVLASWRQRPEFRLTSYWIHLLGVVTGIGTLALGVFGNPFFKDVGLLGNPFHDYENVMTNRAVQHSWFGLISLVVFGLLALWRMKRSDDFSATGRKIYWVGMIIGVALIGAAGYLGAHVMD